MKNPLFGLPLAAIRRYMYKFFILSYKEVAIWTDYIRNK